ncbi:MAG TPA: DUF1127 domain-containing protein [Arenibaculum sp.]|nr:DUF1127 domain-containing protein [Arenibaculum sp.]
MNTMHFDTPVLKPSVAGRAMGAVGTVIHRAVRYHERRRAVAALLAMDDHVLKDIGLHRGGIVDAVYTGGDRPRSAYRVPGRMPTY